jgi:small subunit ribosomal protein S5
LVSVNRVTKVTKGGRAFGFSAIVVVGDENGVVGHGLGKSKDVSEAIAKAVEDAKKNLVRIPLSGQSVPHEQKGKFGGATCILNACISRYRSYCWWCCSFSIESVGIHDVLSKSQGSSNPHNVVKATFDALLQMRSAAHCSKQRGISLEKVFKG